MLLQRRMWSHLLGPPVQGVLGVRSAAFAKYGWVRWAGSFVTETRQILCGWFAPRLLSPPSPRTRPLIPHPGHIRNLQKSLSGTCTEIEFIVHDSVIVPFKVLSCRPSNIRFQMTPSKRSRGQRRSNHPTTLSVWDSDVAIVLDPVDQKLMKDSVKGLKSGEYICGGTI